MSHEHVFRAVYGTPWAILEDRLKTIAEIVRMRMTGERLSDGEIRSRLAAVEAAQGPRSGARSGARTANSIAVIPIYGTIFQRANLLTAFSGGATVESLSQAFDEALADDQIGSIVFDVDSPGGEVGGIEELAAQVRAARGQKPVVAVANTLMASAAYWLASQADEIVASPSSMVGSIGVVMVHQEVSRMAEAEGITTNIIRIPEAKYEGNQWEVLSDDARAHLEQIAGDYYGQFVNAVAQGRGVTAAAVRAGYGEGRVLTAKRAKEASLVDRIDTLDGTIRRLATGRAPATRGASAASGYRVVTTEGLPDIASWPVVEPAIQGEVEAPVTDEVEAPDDAASPDEEVAPEVDEASDEPAVEATESPETEEDGDGDDDALELLRARARMHAR